MRYNPKSIFDGLVREENSYSRLLCNLLSRDSCSRSHILEHLVKESAALITREARISPQETLPNGCRPDIFIQDDQIHIIIEVKTEMSCLRTACQSLGGKDTYLTFLETKAALGSQCLLVYLIPKSWLHKTELQSEVAEHQLRSSRVRVVIKYWEDFATSNLEGAPSHTYEEFQLLLAQRFGSLTFDRTELELMDSDGSSLSLSTLVKFINLIKEVREKAARAGFKASKVESYKGEYGFALGAEGHFWFGLWPDFSKISHTIICFGVDQDKQHDSFRTSYSKEYGMDAIAFEEGRWLMGCVPAKDLTSPDSVESTWRRLELVVGKVLGGQPPQSPN